MQAPHASFWQSRWSLLLVVALLPIALASCVHQPKREVATSTSKASPEWYIAQRDPLTYCPKGHHLPPPRVDHGPAPAYVYLADRTTRFYIPPHAEPHRKQALKLRKLSIIEGQNLPPNVNRTMRWVGRAFARTAVTGVVTTAMLIGGVPQEDSFAANALEAVW